MPSGVSAIARPVVSKVTVIDEARKIVRYDDVLSESDPSPKAFESKNMQAHKDAFTKHKVAAL